MEAFFEKYKDLAMASQRVSGVPASIILAQAYLESGRGTSELTTQDNNFFGTKAGSKWKGAKSLWRTTEYIPIAKKAYYQNYFSTEGRQIISVIPYNSEKEKWIVKDYFRKYKDAESAFTDHTQIYAVRKAKTLVNGSMDSTLWAYKLKEAGYATDVNYPSKLINIIKQNNLTDLDTDAEKKKLTNYGLFFLGTFILVFGLTYYYDKTLYKNNLFTYGLFFLSVILGVVFYLLYLKLTEIFYKLQND